MKSLTKKQHIESIHTLIKNTNDLKYLRIIQHTAELLQHKSEFDFRGDLVRFEDIFEGFIDDERFERMSELNIEKFYLIKNILNAENADKIHKIRILARAVLQ